MRLQPNVRITGADRHQLAQLVADRYQAGESIRALALSIGRSYGFIHALLEEAGADLRHRGGDNRKNATTEPTTSTGAEQ
ncbi:helix-turn-helix domain-containing protein [Nonomuraea sp. NPDC050153]|uniref:helix-turn-helix domain-containing protein n=1 Tax=Nonomuraea sp. NPDC050153 TaxID=3364359 RepID=UPI003787E9D7